MNSKSTTQSTSLREAHVVTIGVGGLGCPAALGLARAGVGTITLVDPDRVEISNLPRQLLHSEEDVGIFKVDSAAATLTDRYPHLRVRPIAEAFGADNGARILADADFAIDATDGIEAKLSINDAAVRARLPFCYAGVLGLGGQALAVLPGRTPCLRCLFPGLDEEEDLATCSRAGIVGPLAGLFGALEANLAIEHLTGNTGRAGRLISYDRVSDRWRNIELQAARHCATCARLAGDTEGEAPRWAM